MARPFLTLAHHNSIRSDMIRSGFNFTKRATFALNRSFATSKSIAQELQVDVGADAFSTHSKCTSIDMHNDAPFSRLHCNILMYILSAGWYLLCAVILH